MDRKLRYYADKYWNGRDHKWKRFTAFRVAQQMKKAGVCKHDMDCYRLLLKGVTKLYRDH